MLAGLNPNIQFWKNLLMNKSDNSTPQATLTVAELCTRNDISVAKAETALASLQQKGLVTGFVAGDLQAPITLTSAAAKYFE